MVEELNKQRGREEAREGRHGGQNSAAWPSEPGQ